MLLRNSSLKYFLQVLIIWGGRLLTSLWYVVKHAHDFKAGFDLIQSMFYTWCKLSPMKIDLYDDCAWVRLDIAHVIWYL